MVTNKSRRRICHLNEQYWAMSDLVYMNDVDLDCPKTDRYGRSVCKVMVAPASGPRGPRTLDAGLGMVTVGMATEPTHASRPPRNAAKRRLPRLRSRRSAPGYGAMPSRWRRGNGASPSAEADRASARNRPSVVS